MLAGILLLSLLVVTTSKSTGTSLQEESVKFSEFVSHCVPLRSDGKIDIPDHIKHIKLDIGLSYSAPMSQHWLSQENDLMVFGFEPHPASVKSILEGAVKKNPLHGQPLEKKYIGKNFFLVPCALGISDKAKVKFFITQEDCGCSSLYTPKQMNIAEIIEVPIFLLSDFFDSFPFDTHPVIEYIKIDAQGADLDIVKSAGAYIAERVVYITLEAENSQYANTHNSHDEIDRYMKHMGFVAHATHHTSDPTYFNTRFKDYVTSHEITIYQKG